MPIPFESPAATEEAAFQRALRGLAFARLARFVALGLLEPLPDDRPSDEIRAELNDAAAILGLPSPMVDNAFERWASLDESRESFVRLFGHTARSACPPYELEYGRGEVFQQTQALADIAGFYAAFGLTAMGGRRAERPDHVAAEWEFLAVAALREAEAVLTGDVESADRCRQARRMFVREHAAAWMPAFFSRLRRNDGDGRYGAVAGLAARLLERECDELGLRRGPSWLELRPVEEEDVTISCGAPDAPNVEVGPRLAAALESRD